MVADGIEARRGRPQNGQARAGPVGSRSWVEVVCSEDIQREQSRNRVGTSWPHFPGRWLLCCSFSGVWRLRLWTLVIGEVGAQTRKRDQGDALLGAGQRQKLI